MQLEIMTSKSSFQGPKLIITVNPQSLNFKEFHNYWVLQINIFLFNFAQIIYRQAL